MFYHSLKLKQTKCICMYFSEERLQYLCKVPHIICSFWTLIFFRDRNFKIVESLHDYHDKSLKQDESVRNSAKTKKKHYTIPDSKRFFFSNTVPITHFGRHLSVFIKTGWGELATHCCQYQWRKPTVVIYKDLAKGPPAG